MPKRSETYKDGYPRMMFLDAYGKIRPQIKNPKHKYAGHNYPYYYGSLSHMVDGMRNALHELPHGHLKRLHQEL